MILAVDFDGTIVDHRFPDVGKPVPGAVKWMKRFQELGAKLILWTMRSDGRDDGGNYLTDAVNYCRENGVEFYIDDAAIGVPLIKPIGFARPCVDWETVGPIVEAMIEAK